MRNKTIHLTCANLSDFCTFRIGGFAKDLYIVYDEQSLYDVCLDCYTHNIKSKVIGMGANLLFDDLGYNGAIIVNKSNEVEFDESSVVASAGANLTKLIQRCFVRGLGGFERLAGIPSTLGGALVNNAGAFLCEISNCVESVDCIDIEANFKPISLTKKECEFAYRDSVFKRKKFIITRAKLNLKQKDKEVIKNEIETSLLQKKLSQPLYFPSAGSVFKRSDYAPSKLIDELGLKGLSVGGAQVSTKHAGFIINTNNATSADVKTLVKKIEHLVTSRLGVTLEREIEYVEF